MATPTQERRRRYYENNKAAVLAKAKAYREANLAKRAAYMREWHKRRKENDPEYAAKRAEYLRQYNAANRERLNAAQAANRAKNRDKVRAAGRAHYAAHRDEYAWRAREKRYGLTREDFFAVLKSQKGKCALCHKKLPENHSLIAVDHCHKTGKRRGLLHRGCNTAVGAYENRRNQVEAYLSAHV